MTSHAPVYSGYQNLHPLTEISRGRYGAGLLLVYDVKKCDHLVAKRIAKRNEDSFERQVTLHIRASSHVNVVRFMGLLPSSTSCFQYAIEYFPDGNLRQLVVDDVGLPDVPSKYIFRQLQLCLEYLHKELGIVHGSVRPDHVLIASVSRCIVKLTNFSNAHPIAARVKMNTKDGETRPLTWKKQLHRLKSFLTNRTASLRSSSGNRFRSRRSIDLGSGKRSEDEKTQQRRFSVTTSKSGCSKSSAKDVDVHEYTVDDYLREIDGEIFSQAFTAPELINATRYVASPAADNWSLTMLAVYCVTGNTPWETATVDNRKYTAFLHSTQRSKSFTPNLNERKSAQSPLRLSKFRSKSLTSLVESMKRKTTSDRRLSLAFEGKIIEVFKQPADKRVSLPFSQDFFSRRWGDDTVKIGHYQKYQFDDDWMKQRSAESWS